MNALFVREEINGYGTSEFLLSFSVMQYAAEGLHVMEVCGDNFQKQLYCLLHLGKTLHANVSSELAESLILGKGKGV